jgi:cytochrome b561
MAEHINPGTQDTIATWLGWLLAVCFLLLFWNINQLPRTPLDQREFLRLLHDSLGLLVVVLAALRLIWFVKGPRPMPPPGLPENSFAFSRAVLATVVATFAVTGLIGWFYAWGEYHREIVLFGINVPALLPDGEGIRTSMGYLHSALSFYYLILFVVWFVVGLYQHFRYRTGLLRLLPGSRV